MELFRQNQKYLAKVHVHKIQLYLVFFFLPKDNQTLMKDIDFEYSICHLKRKKKTNLVTVINLHMKSYGINMLTQTSL